MISVIYKKLLIALVAFFAVTNQSYAQWDNDETESFELDSAPEFPGGQNELVKFIGAQLIYPPLALESSCQGIVHIQFTVETDGSISNIKAVRDRIMCDLPLGDTTGASTRARHAMKSEAIRVVNEMPNWSPAIQRGEAIRMRFQLPIKYKYY